MLVLGPSKLADPGDSRLYGVLVSNAASGAVRGLIRRCASNCAGGDSEGVDGMGTRELRSGENLACLLRDDAIQIVDADPGIVEQEIDSRAVASLDNP